MSLARFCVERPVLTSMVTLIVLVVGAVSLVQLKTDMLPPVELPTLTVRTSYPGASPEVVERLVTEVVEEIVATVPGVEEITSTSSEGSSSVRIRFSWGTDIDTAATDVRSKLEDELGELPEEIERPQIRKFDVASFPIVIMGLSSPLDPVALTTLVDEQVKPRLSRVPGVAQVDPWGEYEREIRVELDPDRLRAHRIPLDAVQSAIGNATLELPTGSVETGDREIALRAPSQLTDLDELRDTVVAEREGALIRVRDVAEVVDSHVRLERMARVNGQLGLRLALRKESDANTVEVAEAILAEIAAIDRDLPHVTALAVTNQGDFIQRSIDNVASSIAYGGILGVLVLFFFLRNLRSTLIIALAIPVSFVATFALIYLAGFTLNLMTLGGLALGVGMMVDNSIVVLDNIFRRREELTEPLRTSAIDGTREVSAAITASTITTLVIFVPLLFVQGVSGQLFRQLAYVVAFSLFCSLLVSLCVVPMLASRLLGDEARAHGGGRFAQRIERALEGLTERYGRALGRGLQRPWSVVGLCLACLVCSLALAPTLGTELFPPSDEGEVRISGEMPVGTRLEVVDAQTRQLEAMVLPLVPETTAHVTSVRTSGRGGGPGSGDITLSLTSAAERARSNEAIADAVRTEVEEAIPGMKVRVRAPQGQMLLQRLLGSNEGQGLDIELYGPDLDELDRLATRVVDAVSAVAGVTDVERSVQEPSPLIDLRTDRDAAADVGLDTAAVARAIEIAVAGRRAGEFRVGASSHRILVQLADAPHRTLDDILDLAIATPSGAMVPLSAVTRRRTATGPQEIQRRDQRRLVTVQPYVEGRPVGSVAEELVEVLAELPRPEGYEIRVAGTYEEQQKASRDLFLALLLAIALVYMVLAAQYESLRDPWVVMLSVPMAATGVLVALALTGTTLNVQSYIGCIVLGGIVVNNAVLLVDQASQLRAEGTPLRAALLEAGRRRLRPILMTSATTALALIPLALGLGEGAEAQAPLARAVLGGLVASTSFTLLLVPAAYLLMHRRDRSETHP
ncbi:MAG: acriflavin resistance protein [Sandaracinus sp.]|nr:acriflavin resistance protein [Sandaracinus sp.]